MSYVRLRRRVAVRWGARVGVAFALARPQFVAAASETPIDRAPSVAPARSDESTALPVARNGLPPMDAPKVIVDTTSVTVDGVDLELEPWFRAGEHVAFLHDLAFVLENKRDLWLHVHPGQTFPGVSALFIGAAKRGGLFKSIVYTLALSGYPNVLLVVQNEEGGLRALPFDGRFPGLARWREQNHAVTLSTELRSDGSVLLGPERAGRHGPEDATLTLDELPAAIVKRWAALAGSAAAQPDAPDHRAVLRFANDTPYSTIVRLADAVSEAKRTFASEDGPSEWPAFVPTLGASERDLDEFRESGGGAARSTVAGRRASAKASGPANVDERVAFYFFGLNAGVRAADVRSLDRAFDADGFGTLPETLTPLGGTVDGGLWRLRTSVEFAFARTSTRNRYDGSKLNVSLLTASFTLGYDLVRFRRSTLFVATGIAGGDLRVWPRMPGVRRTSTGLEPTRSDHVGYSYAYVPFELGFEHLVPVSRTAKEGWGVLFGLRGGAGVRLGGQWQPDQGGDTFSGPRFDAAGLEGRLVLGIGGFVVRPQTAGGERGQD